MATQMTTSSSFSPGSFGHLYIFYSKQQEREKEKKNTGTGIQTLGSPPPPHQSKSSMVTASPTQEPSD